jgi:hypothetical protein
MTKTEMQEEIARLDAMLAQRGDLLTRIANALRGEPGPQRLHGWHDLPEVAGRLRAELLAAQQEIAALRQERDDDRAERLEIAAQRDALRSALDLADCTHREGGDTRHCGLERKCWRCRAEAAEARCAETGEGGLACGALLRECAAKIEADTLPPAERGRERAGGLP